VHAVGAVHDTAFRTPLDVDGPVTPWIVQLVPFHPSASILRCPLLWLKLPTAVHDEAAEHDTPLMSLGSAPVPLGVVWVVHVVPSERSARTDCGTPKPAANPPAAVQAVAAVHDTADS